MEFIAETAKGSVRDLQGVITSLMAYSIVYNCNIDMRLANRVIKRAVKSDDRPLTVDDILDKVCGHFNVTTEQVNSKSRKREFVLAPLCELSPGWRHPVSLLTAAEMLARLRATDKTDRK